MIKDFIHNIIQKSGKSRRTIERSLMELGLTNENVLSNQVENLVILYHKIEGQFRLELRQTIKDQIKLALAEKTEQGFNKEFKEYLLEQSKLKDQQLLHKDKQLDGYAKAVVDLSNKLLRLVDDISMLRLQDSGTIQRLHDKNVLADLLLELKEDSAEYTAISALLKKLNQ